MLLRAAAIDNATRQLIAQAQDATRVSNYFALKKSLSWEWADSLGGAGVWLGRVSWPGSRS